jgi:Zn finger protein HypA/HybF involved in hydrogenase expression
MENLKFRLKVHKMKCRRCDLITLIESLWHKSIDDYQCPKCQDWMQFDHMDDITIIEEGE